MLNNKSQINRQIFKTRRKSVLVINTLNGYEVFDGTLAKEIHSKIFKQKKEAIREIKGSSASNGIVKGVVKIIKKTHDLVNMTKGDILVASMTRPEMVSAMKLAAAIITDEGGVTCHAAIVSRELKIPCVIGTKIATQVFKDGDRVEVDANKGVVRKINK
jgi:pyruvate,water dikinase